jgi:putative peptidoglycan lipid II flippase
MSGFFTVGFWTFLSRIAGFAREIMIASFFGAGPVAQAFQVAFSLPNMFRRFFAEGAFNMAFVPMFSKRVEGSDDPEGFAQDAFSALASILIVLTLIAQAIMPWLVLAMASGFQGTEKFDLAVDFGRICFPYILFISIAALFSGVLNSLGRFTMAAAAPVFLNIILVGFMASAYMLNWDIGQALAWGVPLAGIIQMGLVWWAAGKAGIRVIPRLPRWTPALTKLTVVAGPAALAGGVVQINLLVGRQVASFYDGAIQWLAVADRLYQLPLGVVGIAIGIVLLPDLSRRLRADDVNGSKNAFNRATEFSLALTLPSAAALIVIAEPLTSVLFERGAFTAQDTSSTAVVLAIYGIGLPAFVLQKVMQPLFFAREDTKSPFRFALVAMVLNAVIAIGLSPVIGYVAAAWGTTISSWIMIVLLWNGTRGMGEAARLDARLLRAIPRQVLAVSVMAIGLWGASQLLDEMLHTDFLRYPALALLIIFGIVLYGLSGALFGAFKKSDLVEIRRQK